MLQSSLELQLWVLTIPKNNIHNIHAVIICVIFIYIKRSYNKEKEKKKEKEEILLTYTNASTIKFVKFQIVLIFDKNRKFYLIVKKIKFTSLEKTNNAYPSQTITHTDCECT